MKERVESEINRIVHRLQGSQSPDGAWRFCLESGPLTNAYMIILLRSLRIDDEEFISGLAQRIAALQVENGTWKLFHDEERGNLSATVEAYYALLYAGHSRKDEDHMLAARQQILAQGGLSQTSMLTKLMVSLSGQIPWDAHVTIPIEGMLLPHWAPLHFFDFVGYARVHIAPILILTDRKLVIQTERTPDISELRIPSTADHHSFAARYLQKRIEDVIKFLPYTAQIHQEALNQAKQFMLKRLEADGTLYSYLTSTVLMIFALLSLGYPKSHPVITRAVAGLKTMACHRNGQIHMQDATSTVWDTALLTHALQVSGVSASHPMLQKAGRYLLSRQQDKYGDWVLHNHAALPGGWGFSDSNTINPDIDDTTAALRAISQMQKTDLVYQRAWQRGLNWLLSMQNDDGGWPAFEKNTNKQILSWLPIEGADAVSTDPSTTDLTGRTLEFLGNHAGMNVRDPSIQKAVSWLLRNQEENGSWYGRWGICYIYGTWSAVTGLIAVGVPAEHPAIQKAVQWLLRIQNQDGGWGESCNSDIVKSYVPLGASTPSQTAWAVDTLIAASPTPTLPMIRGIQFLLGKEGNQDWTLSYPTGAALPGGFYFHYNSYRYIWPLIALGHFQKKYG